MREASIVPRPMEMTISDGTFVLKPSTRILVSEDAREAGSYLHDLLQAATGFPLQVGEAEGSRKQADTILLTTRAADPSLGDEGYEMTVTPASVVISAKKPVGIFYGIQSLRQLLPPEIESREKGNGIAWDIPAVRVKDWPRFAWRGMMLDVGRHMFPLDFIKRFIDLMALHKMNVFHWHLTEDQGWRIEIKKYPKLTEVGSWRGSARLPKENEAPDGQRYGGYYTQEQVREIVTYAASRFIRVVPEIEMPGHAVAALASYPELGCTGGPYAVRSSWGIAKDVYCAGNEQTFAFLEDVLDEVIELFPDEYIHIGGDECPKERWKTCPKCQAAMQKYGLQNEEQLQSHFIRRIETFLNTKGRRMIGWDEILEGGLAPNATVMSWRGMDGGLKAAREGHDVVMSPTSHCYLDYRPTEGVDPTLPEWLAYLPLEKSFAFEPVPDNLSPAEAAHILGAQANLWTEFVPTPERADYMVYPRASALAEVMWSEQTGRDFGDFSKRLGNLLQHLDRLEVHYCKPEKR